MSFKILFCLWITPYRIFKGTPQELADLCQLTLTQTSEGLQELVKDGYIEVVSVSEQPHRIRVDFTRPFERDLLRIKAEAPHHLIQMIPR